MKRSRNSSETLPENDGPVFHFRFRRTIVYIIWLSVMMFLCDYFRTWYLIMALIIMIALLGADLTMITHISDHIKAKLDIPVSQVRGGTPVTARITIKNDYIMPSSAAAVHISWENSIFNEVHETELIYPLYMLRAYTETVSFTFPYIGDYSFKITDIRIRDLFGLIDVEIPQEDTGYADIAVLPVLKQDDALLPDILSDKDSGMSSVKQSTVSDSYDIREYVPGDRLKDIHWKVSAHTDTLAVKQRRAVEDKAVNILLAGCKSPSGTIKMLDQGYDLLVSLISSQVPVILFWYDSTKDMILKKQLSDERDIDDAYISFYMSGTVSSERAEALYRAEYPSDIIIMDKLVGDLYEAA